ncbi:glycosyltransferase [Campylobacter jejuni]|nr:glycosyltransferase [Campylobacter jejuni]ECR1615983.1 glycosyltransferase [Campylobacter jejuni]
MLLKKLFKLKSNPKLFFKDFFLNRIRDLKNILKKITPKKFYGFSNYAIVSAVYNVEKYLDDYFKSIINQRLDFKNNIIVILIDDGSTDNSAQIIKQYQKKYPNNIIYIYKKNGGQASARNLGLKYLKKNNINIPWVTFTDPDDFLDRDYFYKIDKFLIKYQGNDICMIGCHLIFYHEKMKSFKDNHPLNFKFNKIETIINNFELNNFVHLHASSTLIKINKCKILFDERLKPNFEDGKFVSQYLLDNINSKSVFLSNAVYFYRKREDNSSTIDTSFNKDYLLLTTKLGTLELLRQNDLDFSFIKFNCLYHLIWQIYFFINKPEKASILNQYERENYLLILEQNFSYINSEVILKFNLAGCWFFHKVGILNCFKKEKPPFQLVYIEDYDPYKEQILLTYYTGEITNIEKIKIDDEIIYPKFSKIIKYDFLDRNFCYQKRLWIDIPKNASGYLEIYIDKNQAMLKKYGNMRLNIMDIRKEFQKRLPEDSNIWVLLDRDNKADDNAEHLYRYIMQNYPRRKIIFALRKNSFDWKRLEKEGFNLVDFGSYEFEKKIKQASKVISSHADQYLMKYITPKSQFVFLQHGVILNDLSRWLNSKRINLFITSSKSEYDSIVSNFTRYKFCKKEVVLTGLPRHDILLKNNKLHTRQILIMPTWRMNIVNTSSFKQLNDNFTHSEYFLRWNSLLNNKKLKALCEKFSYDIIFHPHPNIIPYLKYFNIPSYFCLVKNNESSIQKLFCSSSLLITDYSSVSFEMAYLEKLVIYYQFDIEEFFNHHTLQKGYFDYRKNGFGPVVNNEEKLLIELENFIRKNCKPSGVYKSNMDATFQFKDGKCCERIYKLLISYNKREVLSEY